MVRPSGLISRRKKQLRKIVKKILKSLLTFISAFYIIALALRDASLAQLAEHLTLNQGVQGSNP